MIYFSLIEYLDLARNCLGRSSITALCSNEILKKLKFLDLSGTQMGNEGVKFITEGFKLDKASNPRP